LEGKIMAKILVVDDEEHIRLLYSEELKEEGYDVITAEGGHGLLGRIESDEPDLVVLDIKMVFATNFMICLSFFLPLTIPLRKI
jgi:CheY-like chemotaxis protein